MSNLGGYQKMTTIAKKVGGPKNLVALIAISSIVVGKAIEIASKEGIKIVKEHYKKNKLKGKTSEIIFEVTSDAKNEEGLEFTIGDKYRILQLDHECILIEKIED